MIERLRSMLEASPRYIATSAISITFTQIVLYGLLTLSVVPVGANIAAVLAAGALTFEINRRWTWAGAVVDGLRIVAFWASVLLGLVISSVGVGWASTLTDDPILLVAANVASFGVVWVAKLALFDQYVFAEQPEDAEVPEEPVEA